MFKKKQNIDRNSRDHFLKSEQIFFFFFETREKKTRLTTCSVLGNSTPKKEKHGKKHFLFV